jgi:nucleoid-associated protein YgaU
VEVEEMAKRINLIWIMAVLIAVATLTTMLVNSCGRAKRRTVDVATGEYHTEDEIAEMSDRQKREYCRALESQRDNVQQRFDAMTAELAETGDQITAARKQKDDLERQLLAVESDIRTLDDQIEEVRALPSTWKIRPGESLSSIAALPEIYNDIDKWWKLYEVNKDKVPDPYFCFPDTVIVIPRDWPVD